MVNLMSGEYETSRMDEDRENSRSHYDPWGRPSSRYDTGEDGLLMWTTKQRLESWARTELFKTLLNWRENCEIECQKQRLDPEKQEG